MAEIALTRNGAPFVCAGGVACPADGMSRCAVDYGSFRRLELGNVNDQRCMQLGLLFWGCLLLLAMILLL